MTEINTLPPIATGFGLQPFDDGRQQPQITDQGQRTKGRSAARKRNRGNASNQEEIPLTAGQAAHVRTVKVDARRDGLTEERAATTVTLSKVMRAPQLQLSEDGLTVTGNKGFRTVRATHGTHQGGAWYCEVTVGQLGATGHVRVGWCTSRAELQAPVGFDAYGFCYRDVDGSKVTEGRREAYGEGYKEGDVIGLLIHLPDGGRPFESLDRTIGRYKGQLYLVQEVSTEPQPLKGSLIAFSLNGKSQGVAYRDVLEGTYYAAASLYTMPEQTEGATVTFNFGPDFKYPPPEIRECPKAQSYSLLPSIIHAALAQQEAENALPLPTLPTFPAGDLLGPMLALPGITDGVIKTEDANGLANGGLLPALQVDQILASIPAGPYPAAVPVAEQPLGAAVGVAGPVVEVPQTQGSNTLGIGVVQGAPAEQTQAMDTS